MDNNEEEILRQKLLKSVKQKEPKWKKPAVPLQPGIDHIDDDWKPPEEKLVRVDSEEAALRKKLIGSLKKKHPAVKEPQAPLEPGIDHIEENWKPPSTNPLKWVPPKKDHWATNNSSMPNPTPDFFKPSKEFEDKLNNLPNKPVQKPREPLTIQEASRRNRRQYEPTSTPDFFKPSKEFENKLNASQPTNVNNDTGIKTKRGGSVPASGGAPISSSPTSPPSAQYRQPIRYSRNVRRNFSNILYDQVISTGFGALGRKLAGAPPDGSYEKRPYKTPYYSKRPRYVNTEPRRSYNPLSQLNSASNRQSSSVSDLTQRMDRMNLTLNNVQQDVNRLLFTVNHLSSLIRDVNNRANTPSFEGQGAAPHEANNSSGLGNILGGAAGALGGGALLKKVKGLFKAAPAGTNGVNPNGTVKPSVTKMQGFLDTVKKSGARGINNLRTVGSNITTTTKAGIEHISNAAKVTGNVGRNLFGRLSNSIKGLGSVLKSTGAVAGKALGPLSVASSLYGMHEMSEEKNDAIRSIADDPLKASEALPVGSVAKQIADEILASGKKYSIEEVAKLYQKKSSEIQHIGQHGRMDKVRIEEIEAAFKSGKDEKDGNENVKYITGGAFSNIAEVRDHMKNSPDTKEITKRQRPTIQPPPVVPSKITMPGDEPFDMSIRQPVKKDEPTKAVEPVKVLKSNDEQSEHRFVAKHSIIFEAPTITFKGDVKFPSVSGKPIETFDNPEIRNDDGSRRTFGGNVGVTTVADPSSARTPTPIQRPSAASPNIPSAIAPSPFSSGSYNAPSISPNSGGMPPPTPYGQSSNRYGSSPSVNVALPPLKGDAKQGMKILMDKGWSREAAAGIMGNLVQESGLNVRAHNKKEDAQGIAQWRDSRLRDFEKKFGKSMLEATFAEQMEFVDYELRTSHRNAGDALKNAKTAEEAAYIVDAMYEKSAGTERGIRMSHARTLFGQKEETKTAENSNDPSSADGGGSSDKSNGSSGDTVASTPSRGPVGPEPSSAGGGPAPARTPTPIQAIQRNAPSSPDATASSPEAATSVDKPSVTGNEPSGSSGGPADNVKMDPSVNSSKIDPDLMSKFNDAAKDYGKPVTVTSGYRDDEYQAKLWVRGNILHEPGISMPARPKETQTVEVGGKTYRVTGGGGGSAHSTGAAIDVAEATAMNQAGVLSKHGLSLPFGSSDPVHIQKTGASGRSDNDPQGRIGNVPQGANSQEANHGISDRFSNRSSYPQGQNGQGMPRGGMSSLDPGRIMSSIPSILGNNQMNIGGYNSRRMNPGIQIPNIRGGGIGGGLANMAIGMAVNGLISGGSSRVGARSGTINSPVYSRGNSINVNPYAAATTAYGNIVNSRNNVRSGERLENQTRSTEMTEIENKRKIQEAFDAPVSAPAASNPSVPNGVQRSSVSTGAAGSSMDVHPSPALMRELTATGSQPSIVKSPSEMGIGLDRWGNAPTV